MWPDDSGSWDLGQAYDAPVTDSTVLTDLSMYGQAVDNSGTGSGWGGFLQGALGKVLNYSLAKDAAQSQAQMQQQQQQALATQPLLTSTSGGLAINPTGMLLIGGILLVVVLVARGGKG